MLRIILFNFGTLRLDQGTFIAWSNILVNGGFKHFYSGWSDYLPGYLYVLNILGQIAKLHIISETLLYKLPAILADLATGYLIYKILKKKASDKWSLAGAALYIFNPAVFANSTLWGQVDSLTAFFSLLAIYLLEENIYLSALSLAIGGLVKPQAVFLVPIVLLYAFKNKWNMKKYIIYGAIGLAVIILGFLPFYGDVQFTFGRFVNFFLSRINLSLNQYPYTSVNAFNFWGIIGFWKEDNISGIIGLAMFLAVSIFSWIALRKKKVSYYLLSGLIFLFAFTFLTRMHERHLMPALPFLLIASFETPALIFSYLGLSTIYCLNLLWAYSWITNSFESIFSEGILKLLSFSVFGFSLYSLYVSLKNISLPKINLALLKKPSKIDKFPKINIKFNKYIIFGVIAFAFAARILFLWSPSNEYFDEVYHAFTAKEMMNGNTAAWEWWNTPPQGFAYEWTHPPLAKELMIGGMLIFGQTSFGWRVPAALAGVGILFFVFKISKELFDDDWLPIFATGFLALDGLLLVMSRIGMNDSYLLFFVLASFYYYLKDKNLISAIFAGLALSSKWSALWFFPILAVTHFVLKKKFKKSYLWYLLIPVIYISTYLPLFTSKQIQNEYVRNNRYELKKDKTGIVPLDMFIDTQKQMWWYHTNLKATHPYTSPWWEWPIEARPIYLYTSGYGDDGVANIYAFGNPVVFWFGLGSVFLCLYWAVRDRNKRLGLVCFSYFAFFVPWALSPRIMFLYHYLPSLPFLGIAAGYVFRKYPKLVLPVFGVGLLLFIYFYPHWVGIKVPTSLDMSYYWFPSWR